MKLSAVIITYNEEANIERCLVSLIGIADEIIVVDSFSTDETSQICNKYNVRFYQIAWKGFSNAKNYGNSLAAADFIISIDADEVVSEELKTSILAVKNELNGAYRFNRLTNYVGNWVRFCGWYPDAKVRIFPKNKASWVGDYVHETLELDSQLAITHLKGDLLHYSYHSIAQHYARIERYSELHAQQMLKKGKRSNLSKVIFAPLFKFLKDYIIKLGILDGQTGYTICKISAKAVHLKYRKLYQLQKIQEIKAKR